MIYLYGIIPLTGDLSFKIKYKLNIDIASFLGEYVYYEAGCVDLTLLMW